MSSALCSPLPAVFRSSTQQDRERGLAGPRGLRELRPQGIYPLLLAAAGRRSFHWATALSSPSFLRGRSKPRETAPSLPSWKSRDKGTQSSRCPTSCGRGGGCRCPDEPLPTGSRGLHPLPDGLHRLPPAAAAHKAPTMPDAPAPKMPEPLLLPRHLHWRQVQLQRGVGGEELRG